MRTFLVYFQYQADDRCQNTYKAFAKNEDDLETAVYLIPEYADLCAQCVCDYAEDDDDIDEQFVELAFEDVTDNKEIIESPWFKWLITLVDERNK